MIIQPYRSGGTWVFDDEAVGLCREPFVAGVPEMIDELVAGIPDAEDGFRMLFSGSPFPGATRYDRQRQDGGGWWYRKHDGEAGRGGEGWLCPALFKYFEEAPGTLYAKAEAVKR